MDVDLVVVGAGVSGLALSFRAAEDGAHAIVLERQRRIGGCLRSRRENGFWYEVGGHTVYNSYGAWLDLIVDTGLASRLVPRGEPRAHFGLLRQDRYTWLTPPRVLFQLNWLEAAPYFLTSWLGGSSATMAERFTRLVGPGNYERVLSPFLGAVPCQPADEFPAEGAGSLFKTRERRAEFPRSFGVEGGLQTVCDAMAEADGVEVRQGITVKALSRVAGGFAVETADGTTVKAERVALAVPPNVAARLLAAEYPEVARLLETIETVEVESVGVSLPRDRCWMPPCAFVVPVDDIFRSMVTRDPFPDEHRRGFTFHFRGDVPREQQLARMSEVLRVDVAELGEPVVNRVTLPSPRPGHDAIVQELDTALAGEPLGLTGNYFAGMSIEDCVQRSASEWTRLRAVA